jgi:P27 family predicted phage terminase small subunit
MASGDRPSPWLSDSQCFHSEIIQAGDLKMGEFQAIRGRARKPAHLRQRRNAVPEIALRTEEEALEIPPAPEWLSDTNKAFWHTLWSADLARALHPKTEMIPILRLFELYEERDRLVAVFKQRPLDSAEPIKVNPLRNVIATCDDHILKLEDRFGMNPISRLRLGPTMSRNESHKPANPPASKQSIMAADPRKILKAIR